MSDAAAPKNEKLLPMPDCGDFLFIFVMQLSVFLLPNLLFSDGSAGWHIFTGKYILETGKVPHVDLLSATFPDRAWVAYEWLFDWMLAVVVQLGGLKLLGVVLSASIAFLFLAIYDRTRKEGCNIPTTFFLVVVAILTAAMHWLARPHLITFWFVWIYVTSLEDYYRDKISIKKLGIILVIANLIWVNCHPAFLVGFVILAIYVTSSMLQARFMKSDNERQILKKKFISLVVLGFVMFACTFANPYGVELHHYILSYLQADRAVINATNEYLSPVFKGGLHPTCLEILFFMFAAGLFVSRQTLSLPGFLTCLAFGHASLFAVRNMPLYAIVATPFIGRLWGRPPQAEPVPDRSQPFLKRIGETLKAFQVQENRCKMHIIPIVYTLFLMGVAITGGSFMDKPMVTSDFDPKAMPVAPTKYIKEHNIDPKYVFNFDNWAGYLIYTLNKRVFMDDRADFYGHEFYAEYSVVMASGNGWQKVLDKNKIEYVLFPKDSAIAQTLRADSGWQSVSSDEASELFQRKH